jgi:hypothetical protein
MTGGPPSFIGNGIAVPPVVAVPPPVVVPPAPVADVVPPPLPLPLPLVLPLPACCSPALPIVPAHPSPRLVLVASNDMTQTFLKGRTGTLLPISLASGMRLSAKQK